MVEFILTVTMADIPIVDAEIVGNEIEYHHY